MPDEVLNLLTGFEDQLPPVVACGWPDGGCGAPIRKITTVRGKTQAVDATPARGILYGEVTKGGTALEVAAHRPLTLGVEAPRLVGAVGWVFTDHHVTCVAWQRAQERRRAHAHG